MTSAAQLATEIEHQLADNPRQDTAHLRAIRREYTKLLEAEPAGLVLQTSLRLISTRYRWIAYELVRHHPQAFESVSPQRLVQFGKGIHSWWTTDAFARTLAGPLWLRRRAPDRLFHRWATSPDVWWRRAALVSTVALNMRSQGGLGDTARTLRVCRLLVADHNPMVAKALSWALRVLVPRDPAAVEAFLQANGSRIAPLIRREVNHKLRTGLKAPGRHR
jgi:3-methyladenine DNA glycosylase AlkD